MKASTILIAFVSILLCGCGSNTEPAITGIYVAHFKNGYTITDDTLNITEYSSKDNLYKIESRAAYNKIRNGAIQPKQFEHESHIATWKSDSQIFQENDISRQLHFVAAKSLILIGDTEYHKIK